MQHDFTLSHSPVSAAGQANDLKILVVSSDPADSRITCDAFRAAGLTSELHWVDDEGDALKYLRKEGKYKDVRLPDLIFLELLLRKISGLDLLRAIKSTPEWLHIPIVVASGVEDPTLVREVYSLYGNCFLRKPNDWPQLLDCIGVCYRFWANVATLSRMRWVGDGARPAKGKQSK